MQNFTTSKTGSNKGTITILFPHTNKIAYGPFNYCVNNQLDEYWSECVTGLTIQELANKIALRKGDEEGI